VRCHCAAFIAANAHSCPAELLRETSGLSGALPKLAALTISCRLSRWNAASNDVGVNLAGANIDGAQLVGGPEATDAGGMDSDTYQRQLSQLGAGLGLGVGYGKYGGRGFHKGAGWDSHGSVTCHSYGCAVHS